ncbi:Hypothetical predicted protein [Octopus vulgaris]|uniref:Uncharacterized protein n=1 Tax=Octopus vulgaris TaxID=6645 RepID=A0AA36AYI9_OCTVU|nr:Hypothetical predicted protein [Octopus vulgaris]
MLFRTLSKSDAGVNIRYRCEPDSLTSESEDKNQSPGRPCERLPVADDGALAALNEPDLQELSTFLVEAAKSFGLTISLRKTEVML